MEGHPGAAEAEAEAEGGHSVSMYCLAVYLAALSVEGDASGAGNSVTSAHQIAAKITEGVRGGVCLLCLLPAAHGAGSGLCD